MNHDDPAKLPEKSRVDETTQEEREELSSALELKVHQDNSPTSSKPPGYILPAIVFSQLFGTALWFAGNAVLPDLTEEWDTLDESSLGYLTSSVQIGFILGTFLFALLSIVDRFPPTKVFMVCALCGATFNAILPLCDRSESLAGLVILRLLTGACLAGIYPVGMKVAADWYAEELGKALGWLVGALAVGSALPFLLRQIDQSWQALLWETSGLAALGGLAVGMGIPEGPHRKPGTQKFDPAVLCSLFSSIRFASASLSYWGHMWELYAFWTWTPVVWEAYLETRASSLTASLITFLVIASGGLGCVLGGYLSLRYGSAWVAFGSLAISGALCVLSPALYLAPIGVAFPVYLVWGMAVVADSPQFSTLVAQTAPAQSKGTALTIVNCVGFTVTIGSIQLLAVPIPEQYIFLLLVPGPVVGLWSLWRYHIQPRDTGDNKTYEEDSKQAEVA